MTDAKTKLLLSLAYLAAVFMVGTAGYAVIESQDLLEAAYASALVISTVGLGEPWTFSRAGQAWTIFVAVFGVGTALLAFSSLQALVTGGEVRRVLGRRRLNTKIAGLKGHHVICGYGRMGRRVSQALVEQHLPIVIIESDAAKTAEIEENGWLYILGDASDEKVLQQAGIEQARGLVAVLPHDAHNVYVTLAAKGFNPDIHVIARAEQPTAESMLRRAGADRVVCPAEIGATRITNLLIRPKLVDFVENATEGVDLEIDELVLTAASPLLGKTLSESQLRDRTGGMVVAIKSAGGKTQFSPSAATVLNENDTLVLIGPTGLGAAIEDLA